MPRFRMFASVGWIHNSKVDLGVVEAADDDEAAEEAQVSAIERMDVWVEEIPEDGEPE